MDYEAGLKVLMLIFSVMGLFVGGLCLKSMLY